MALADISLNECVNDLAASATIVRMPQGRPSEPPDPAQMLHPNRLYWAITEDAETTQAALAKALGKQPQWISKYVRGYIPLDLPQILAFGKALGVRPLSLLLPDQRRALLGGEADDLLIAFDALEEREQNLLIHTARSWARPNAAE